MTVQLIDLLITDLGWNDPFLLESDVSLKRKIKDKAKERENTKMHKYWTYGL